MRRRPGQAVIGIVDDDESVRLALGTCLRSMGIASRTFTSGSDLLGSELLAHFSCLILGQHLRGMDGLETLRAIRQRGCEAPVIMISSDDDLEARRRASAAGAFAFAFVDKRLADLSLMGVVRDALDAAHGGPARPAQ